ncbi:ComF family protein [Noviherbaspirillum denitrificans]|uniref:Amidophosphoribosyltransferase n=1 Tax=Noviherbaspirillum denitrificans TaxID=1968433 RepID=A0A254TP64_9BURK|nr:ComF family protein [Noviherbaspirillum denitrificans]OWW21508.1 amidophosphoribosyltransferase [Noviherbaspirillum denitrificans]
MFARMRPLLHHLLSGLPNVLPSSCALCGNVHHSALCDGCRAQFFRPAQARCTCCGIPLPRADTRCGECIKQPPAFDATIVAADYAPPIDRLVLALKFGNRLEIAPLFAQLLHPAAGRMPLPQLLTAVPLGPQRLVQRGFNQALEIARPLSKQMRVRLEPHLVARHVETQAQSMLHPDERHKNIRNAFVVPAYAMQRVRGRHIGVVDDVMTTGETLNELAATLKRFGAVRVTNIVFARTPQR